MKKLFVLVLILAMAMICQAIQPALIKDPFNWYTNLYGWLPADDTGTYWWRIDFSSMGGSITCANSLCIDQVVFGIPRKGKVFIGHGGLDWTESGTWASGTDTTSKWTYRSCGTQNAYVDVIIPAGYNRIHLLSFNVTSGNGALLAITWDDASTTGLDITSYDSGTSTGQVEIVIATNASPDGVKKLRIKHNDTTGTARLIGVRCWDTDAAGDPTEADTDANALGNDFIDKYHIGSYYREAVTGIEYPAIVPQGSTIDWAMRWKTNSIGTYKWSGGQNHWSLTSSEAASYLYHSGSTYATNGPDIFVDGSDSGGKLDAVRNKLWKGYSIHILSMGYLDSNSNETEEATEPDVIWGYTLSSTGMSIDVSILWNNDCQVDTGCYCPMWDVISINTADKLIYPYDSNEYSVGALHNQYGVQEACYYDATKNCLIKISTVNPSLDGLWSYTASKLFIQTRISAMPGTQYKSAGDIWFLGGNYQVRKVDIPPNKSRYGISLRKFLK